MFLSNSNNSGVFSRLAIVGLLCVASISASNAAIISADLFVANDDRAFIDTYTGNEWLKLNNTLYYSINQFSEDNPGSTYYRGLFPGFRVATSAEVNTLFENTIDFLGLTSLTSSVNGARTGNRVDHDLVEIFTDNVFSHRDASRQFISSGFHYSADGTNTVSSSFNGNTRSVDAPLKVSLDFSSPNYTLDTSSSGTGLWMVSEVVAGTLSAQLDATLIENRSNSEATSVNAPATLSLIALGLAGVFFRRKGLIA